MFVLDMPDVPPQYAPIVIAQAAQAKDPAKTDRTIGVCHLVENKPEPGAAALSSVSPAIAVYAYLTNQEHRTIDEATYTAAKITVLQAPEYGKLEDIGHQACPNVFRRESTVCRLALILEPLECAKVLYPAGFSRTG